jgi:hypothetical protein
MAKPDWNAEALTMARYVRDHMMEAQRGAMPWKQSRLYVVFGNDGATGEHAAREIEVLRALLMLDHTVRGFAIEETGTSWAMLVEEPLPRASLRTTPPPPRAVQVQRITSELERKVWAVWSATAAGPTTLSKVFKTLDPPTDIETDIDDLV